MQRETAREGRAARAGASDVAGADALLFEVLLVIIFGAVEGPRRQNLRDDGALENALFFEQGFGIARGSFLLRVVEENGRAVLRANVGPWRFSVVGSWLFQNVASNSR